METLNINTMCIVVIFIYKRIIPNVEVEINQDTKEISIVYVIIIVAVIIVFIVIAIIIIAIISINIILSKDI